MIIVIGGEKGGTSKSTIATNLAAIFAQKGEDTLLVNTDPQNTAGNWSAVRRQRQKDHPQIPCVSLFGEGLPEDLADLKKRYSTIIVDTGGRDTAEFRLALLVSQLFVMPLKASHADTWTIKKVSEVLDLVAPLNPKVRSVLLASQINHSNRERARASLGKAVEKFPRFQVLNTVVVTRQAYIDALGEGLSVGEMKPRDVKAATEMAFLYDEVMKWLRGENSAANRPSTQTTAPSNA